MSLGFHSDSTEFDSKKIHGAVTELENAVIALFWEGEMPRLGTLTVTLPNKVSSNLIGNRDRFLSQMIGEHIATFYEKMALVSINLSVSTGSLAGRTLLDLTKKLIKK